ncbi:2-amino-4-hydroxy-6-hydroxymethyldihydropteridine diphosphokinase [Sphingomonas sp.]|uniref:2-amino-4-hydroxy-6- hydroxymethyldihydropteridine diphosphokinase n=1 Tax=Sphingomonas sp. TaxID=28214 RepID=UPI003AFFDBCE
MGTTTYLVALGANRRSRHGSPAQAVAAAIARLDGVVATSPIVASAPLGPSTRRFANAAVLVESDLAPPAMLVRLKGIERDFGRRRGRRWGARAIDLDLILWSVGVWRSPGLTVPHPAYRERRFVLDPLLAIAPGWRDPADGLTVRHLQHRLTASRPVNRREDPLMGP